MGARQSYLYIYLKNKDTPYTEDGYTVTPSKTVVNGCRDFEVVSYSIKYPANPMSYDIYIYETKTRVYNASYLFAYCSPSKPSHVAKEISVYYSVLAPHKPLVISFHREGGDIHKCEIEELRNAGWDWAYKISKYASPKELIKLLKDQFEKLLRNRTIGFVSGNANKEVVAYKQELGDKKNFRFIFLTKGENASLGSDCVYSIDFKKHEPSCTKSETQVDPYFLQSVIGDFYDGIIVYYARDSALEKPKLEMEDHKGMLLLFQFVDVRKTTILIKRKDKDGYWWSQEAVQYDNDQTLIKALDDIKEKSSSNNVNTILLDKKENYKGVNKVDSIDRKSFKQYTHTFGETKKTAILFERKYTEISQLKELEINAIKVEVYYLKVTSTKGEKEDTKPFLIVFDIDGKDENKNAYHFNNKTEFKQWVKFTFTEKGSQKALEGDKLIKKLYEKLELLEKYGYCTVELHYLRELADKILHLQDEEAPPIIPTEPPEQRPVPYPPIIPEPEDNTLIIIIGCSVGGGVFVISSAVIYGIYWYNTTIKLLT